MSLAGCERGESKTAALDSLPEVQKPLDQIAQIHFVGSANVFRDTNAALLGNIWSMPETQKLKDQTLNKLALAPFKLAKLRGIASTNDFAQLMRPLLDDLVQAESWMELRGETNQTPDFALAVQLDATRAELWRTNLSKILIAWTGLPVTEINSNGSSGWELKKHDAPNLIRFQRAGGWIVLSAGEDKIRLADELVADIRATGRPCAVASNYVLNVEGDLTRIADLIPLPEDIQGLQLSSVHASWGTGEEGLWTHIVSSRGAAFDFKPEPWRIPTNLIHQPLAGFTAVQGVGDRLASHLPMFKMSPMPQEYFVWTMQGIPLQTFIAVPVENVSNALEQLTPALLGLNTNPPGHMVGKIEIGPNASGFIWTGLPFVAPFLQGIHEANGDFLFSGAFPNTQRGGSLLEAIRDEVLGRTNLIYYSWEITAERLDSWRNVSQMYFLLAKDKQLDGTSAGGQWLEALTGRLGNNVTEMFLTQPDELTLDRKSSIGFTSFELVMLANWLETPNFPFDKPVLPLRAAKRNPRKPVNTAPAMPGLP